MIDVKKMREDVKEAVIDTLDGLYVSEALQKRLEIPLRQVIEALPATMTRLEYLVVQDWINAAINYDVLSHHLDTRPEEDWAQDNNEAVKKVEVSDENE